MSRPSHSACLSLTAAFLMAALFFSPFAAGQSQPPINIIFDMHSDPLPQANYPVKLIYYQTDQLDNGNWVLDQTEPLGVEISYLACGEFMEFVCQDGAGGPGALFLQRIYSSGGQIASHSHNEYRRGAFDWPSLPYNATLPEAAQSWTDNITWVNNAILTAYGPTPPEPLDVINCVKGAHLPKTEHDYHAFMDYFGIEIREGGAEEDYYGLYNHHILNPFRPSETNYMSEDLSAPFVAIPQGAVIGKAAVHHGIFQDMTAPNVKRMFIQAYLNWRHNDRNGLPEKVWCFGWGSHNHDYQPGSQTRTDMVEMINWLNDNFIGKVDATGSVIAGWNTQRGAGEDYFAWEAAHPGVSSFDSNGSYLDWNDYQYLRAVCQELWEAQHAADLNMGGGITAWHLNKGPKNIVVAFSDSGAVTEDFSAYVSNPCRVVGAETGLLTGDDSASVTLESEPVIITEAAPTIAVFGTPALGQTILFTVSGDPAARGFVYASTAPDSALIPYVGRRLISPSAPGFRRLGEGPMTGGSFTLPVAIPNNPSLSGVTFFSQGVEKNDLGEILTVNSLEITIL